MSREALGESVSPVLLQAQQRLLALRSERGIAPVAAVLPASGYGGNSSDRAIAHPARGIDLALLGRLPDHLGWGSERLTTQLRQALARKSGSNAVTECPKNAFAQPSAVPACPTPAEESTPEVGSAPTNGQVENAVVRLYPTVALGMLQANAAAPGRVWLILRWLDRKGQGWIALDRVRQLLCTPATALQLCSWRQLRSLLARGERVFWEQRGSRIWLRSVPKVAKALNVDKLSGYSVDLPLAVLFKGMGAVRAHFYASFHSGRKVQNPISRAALTKLSNVSPRSQQNYERRTHVQKRRNYAIGPRLGSERAEEIAWRNGSACFSWHDHARIFSEQEHAYLAWQIPNSYVGPHKQRPYGRQRQFNRQLTVLSNKGMTGNDQEAEDIPRRRYFGDACRAIRSATERRELIYWPDNVTGRWYCLAGSDATGG